MRVLVTVGRTEPKEGTVRSNLTSSVSGKTGSRDVSIALRHLALLT